MTLVSLNNSSNFCLTNTKSCLSRFIVLLSGSLCALFFNYFFHFFKAYNDVQVQRNVLHSIYNENEDEWNSI